MPALASKYDSTFNGTGFFELFSSSFSADESAEADANAVHYPGSNDNTIKDGGNGIRTITVAFAADTTDYNTLKGLLGSSHTLVCRSSDINTTAFLKSYSAGKLAQFDIYRGSFTFWVE
jgi:hypothetical protein